MKGQHSAISKRPGRFCKLQLSHRAKVQLEGVMISATLPWALCQGRLQTVTRPELGARWEPAAGVRDWLQQPSLHRGAPTQITSCFFCAITNTRNYNYGWESRKWELEEGGLCYNCTWSSTFVRRVMQIKREKATRLCQPIFQVDLVMSKWPGRASTLTVGQGRLWKEEQEIRGFSLTQDCKWMCNKSINKCLLYHMRRCLSQLMVKGVELSHT